METGFTAAFISAFVTFFVVIDPPGVMPIFASLTDGTPKAYGRKMAVRSVIIGATILGFFGLFGTAFLGALGISLDAFRAAGGVMLFIIALEMVFEKRTERRDERTEKFQEDHDDLDDISVFPLGIPLIAGPGAIASIMLLTAQNAGNSIAIAGVWAAASVTILMCFVLFLAAAPLMALIGKTIAASITRVLGVILAALAAQFIFDAIKATFL
ncbi:MAG: MarC family protein [Sphingomonadales bacterium]